MEKESFWDFPHSSKLDVLREDRHSRIICAALADPLTNLDQDDHDWIVFGEEEALLIQVSSSYLRIVLQWYYQILRLFN